MIFLLRPAEVQTGTPAPLTRRLIPNGYDAVVVIVLLAVLIAVAHGGREMGQSLATLEITPVSLSPWNLPEYALRSTLRMFAALLASLLFTFTMATLAATSRKAELLIVPALDILQSVPVRCFLSFTVVFFM